MPNTYPIVTSLNLTGWLAAVQQTPTVVSPQDTEDANVLGAVDRQTRQFVYDYFVQLIDPTLNVLKPAAIGSGTLVNNVPAGALMTNSVATSNIQTGAVTGSTDNTVTTSNGKLATGAVHTADVAAKAITLAKLGDDVTAEIGSAIPSNTITTAMLQDLSVTTGKLHDTAVTTAKIANNAVGPAQLVNGAVGPTQLADNAVQPAKLASASVTNAAIADGTIDGAKLSGNVDGSLLVAGAVTTTQLGTGAVETGNILGYAVTNAKLAGGITGSLIAQGTIVGTTVIGSTPTLGNLAAATVTQAEIASGAVGTLQLAPSCVTAGKIGAGEVNGSSNNSTTPSNGNLANGAVKTADIADYAVTPSKIALAYDSGCILVSGSGSHAFSIVKMQGDAHIDADGTVHVSPPSLFGTTMLVEQATAGTNAGNSLALSLITRGHHSFTPAAWAVLSDINSNLSSSPIAYPSNDGKIYLNAGTYVIEASVPAIGSGLHKALVIPYTAGGSAGAGLVGTVENSGVVVLNPTPTAFSTPTMPGAGYNTTFTQAIVDTQWLFTALVTVYAGSTPSTGSVTLTLNSTGGTIMDSLNLYAENSYAETKMLSVVCNPGDTVYMNNVLDPASSNSIAAVYWTPIINGPLISVCSRVSGQITISNGGYIKIQHWLQKAIANGLGMAFNYSSNPENYSTLKLVKIS